MKYGFVVEVWLTEESQGKNDNTDNFFFGSELMLIILIIFYVDNRDKMMKMMFVGRSVLAEHH